jgi:hypothetical protein
MATMLPNANPILERHHTMLPCSLKVAPALSFAKCGRALFAVFHYPFRIPIWACMLFKMRLPTDPRSGLLLRFIMLLNINALCYFIVGPTLTSLRATSYPASKSAYASHMLYEGCDCQMRASAIICGVVWTFKSTDLYALQNDFTDCQQTPDQVWGLLRFIMLLNINVLCYFIIGPSLTSLRATAKSLYCGDKASNFRSRNANPIRHSERQRRVCTMATMLPNPLTHHICSLKIAPALPFAKCGRAEFSLKKMPLNAYIFSFL